VTLLEGHRERTIITIGKRLDPLGSDALPWERLHGADGVYFTAGDRDALRHARMARVLVASPRARTALSHPGPRLDALVFSGHDRDEEQWAERLRARAETVARTEGAAGGRWWRAAAGEGRWSFGEGPSEFRSAGEGREARSSSGEAISEGRSNPREGRWSPGEVVSEGRSNPREGRWSPGEVVSEGRSSPREGRWSPIAPPGEVRDSYGCGDSFAAGFTYALAGGTPPAEAAALGAECGARCLTRAGAP
jgi:sugar/nucleoside kinase (ribokinase family)